MAEVISLIDYKEKQQKKIEAVELAEKLTKNPCPDATLFNHEFYKLVDLFMQQTYPEYTWRFEVWLDDKLKNTY